MDEEEEVSGVSMMSTGPARGGVSQENAFWVPLFMSLVAGGATGIGALVVLMLDRNPRKGFMCFSLGLAAGVMITVSLFDMYMPQVMEEGFFWPTVSAGIGATSFWGLMKLLPHPERLMLPTTRKESVDGKEKKTRVRQWRLGVLMLIVLTAHNFPEGLAVSISNLKSENLGFVVATAIALHNIPEGLTIAVPLYAATGNKKYAIGMAFCSGLSEPFGALLALTTFHSTFVEKPYLINYVLCFVAGIMVTVSCIELIPEALAYNDKKSALIGGLVGGILMMITIWLQPE